MELIVVGVLCRSEGLGSFGDCRGLQGIVGRQELVVTGCSGDP